MKPFVGSALLSVGLSACMMQVSLAAPKDATAGVREVTLSRYYTGSPSGKSAGWIERVVFRSDGTALYFGKASFVKKGGSYEGRIDPQDFAKLAALVNDEFMEMPSRIGQPKTVSAKGGKFMDFRVDVGATRGGQVKRVTTFGEWRPKQLPLLRVTRVMDGLLSKVFWRQVELGMDEQKESN